MVKKVLTRIDPLLMNAFNNVNLAAACVVTSVEYAKEIGVPESKWIYVLGGAGTRDKDCKVIENPSWQQRLTCYKSGIGRISIPVPAYRNLSMLR